MKKNIKLILSYDGSAYLGWQASNVGVSIESILKEVLEKILQQEVQLQAASRTDAGVHAEAQVVNFFLEKPRNLEHLHKSLNQLLPKDIRVAIVEEAPDDFHPTLKSKGKEYHYRLTRSHVQLPFDRLFAWHYPFSLDLAKMETATKFFIGKHDFQAFGNAADPKPKDTIRTLYRLDIISSEEELRFEIHGNNFLYKMVRNLVGTLVYIGAGKLSLEEAEKLIASKDRTLAGMTAPAHGLLLKKVFYV
ncbi:MAG: tRNA pseudouridine(38-40) synthase TruA [Simkania sp.]|nr:tRNA pseudouridine(38-40) synthase TruA [Simkania sp.]MCB1083240.1 tRNA pseudouridine(38-40) synthase TruA [Simkania sp.]MCP5490929.1 tRNA pseudouridine(38-40) synthase TruA [Chlamydiales bacterium]